MRSGRSRHDVFQPAFRSISPAASNRAFRDRSTRSDLSFRRWSRFASTGISTACVCRAIPSSGGGRLGTDPRRRWRRAVLERSHQRKLAEAERAHQRRTVADEWTYRARSEAYVEVVVLLTNAMLVIEARYPMLGPHPTVELDPERDGDHPHVSRYPTGTEVTRRQRVTRWRADCDGYVAPS
jgi:hypothetical protein